MYAVSSCVWEHYVSTLGCPVSDVKSVRFKNREYKLVVADTPKERRAIKSLSVTVDLQSDDLCVARVSSGGRYLLIPLL